jgi:SAM-dependent methyltransferase
MTPLDRFIQCWRIRKARRFISQGADVLDIGASDGSLFEQVPHIGRYVGVDPDLDADRTVGPSARLVKGLFPQCIPSEKPFDCITMLAVLEHIPTAAQPRLAHDCARYLKPGGYLVITVPSPAVDRILNCLKAMRLIHGMSLEEHYGYDVRKTPELFGGAGFTLRRAGRFQLGLNNLFVFARGDVAEACPSPAALEV